MNADPRRHSPAAERNQGPILLALQRLLPRTGQMLEIASGTGQHAAHFAAGLPEWHWQPSDSDAQSLASTLAWCAGQSNVAPPLMLDVMAPSWPGVPTLVDAVFCANMLHISPWTCCTGLMQGAARHLAPHGVLITYGPYLEDEVPTADGNRNFDADLRSRNPAWGLRRREDVQAQAALASLRLRERVAMPANNLLLVFERIP